MKELSWKCSTYGNLHSHVYIDIIDCTCNKKSEHLCKIYMFVQYLVGVIVGGVTHIYPGKEVVVRNVCRLHGSSRYIPWVCFLGNYVIKYLSLG